MRIQLADEGTLKLALPNSFFNFPELSADSIENEGRLRVIVRRSKRNHELQIVVTRGTLESGWVLAVQA